MKKTEAREDYFEDRSIVKPLAIFAAVGLVGYGVYRYRFKIQELLAQNGIETPWLNQSPTDAFKSGAAKASGAIKHEVDRASLS
ncbi:MAG: hypothetical protein H7301_01480 [Cryobacterium sp.]|nr:hypothetical protein [Oligoflexia bacterium]